MNELMNQLMPYIMLILTAVAGYLATKIKSWIDTKIDAENQGKLLAFVGMTVEYVEQIGINLEAEEKFKLAKSKIILWMHQKGMTVSDEELEILIEAFVHNLLPTNVQKEE